jgi:hypothetical protein
MKSSGKLIRTASDVGKNVLKKSPSPISGQLFTCFDVGLATKVQIETVFVRLYKLKLFHNGQVSIIDILLQKLCFFTTS